MVKTTEVTLKTTLVDADEILVNDVSATDAEKTGRITVANAKTQLGIDGKEDAGTAAAAVAAHEAASDPHTQYATDVALTAGLAGKADASHTHTASEVTDFDTEVSNNADVAANTAARHTHANKATLDAITAAFTSADETKLDGIEAGATGDQTGAEIKALYEAELDTNAYTDAAVAKLAGIEAGATADQTGAEIKALYEAEADTNAFTDAQVSKLAGIEAGATADQSDAEIATAYANQVAKVSSGEITAGTELAVRRFSPDDVRQMAVTHGGGGGGGVTDHGALTGLTDDDHTQYHNDTRGDARYYTQAQVDSALGGKADTSHTHVAANITDFDTEVSNNTDVAANTAARHTHANKAILDAVTAAFTTADETKLDFITITQAVDLDAIETRVNALDAAVILMGTWDASSGTFPGGGSAQAGESWIVSVGGTVDGVGFTANDRIVAIVDNASTTTYAANWHKLDYTDAVLSVAGKTGAVTLAAGDIASGTFADPLIAQSNVTQHQAALSITESQISDLGTYLTDIVSDTTPQLGGMLDVNGQAIGDGTRELLTFTEDASAVNHINIENQATGSGPILSAAGDDTNIDLILNAKGAGNISLGNFTLNADATVGAGQDNYVLTYDHASGLWGPEAAAGGGGSPGGSSGDIQYNNASSFAGSYLKQGINVIEQRNSINAQAFRVYNTYTDASNNEFGAMRWASNNLDVGTFKAGTGSDRNIRIVVGGSVAGSIGTSGWLIQDVLNVQDQLVLKPVSRTIAAGVANGNGPWVRVDTESAAATDDLDTLNSGTDGAIVIISATNDARTVVVKHGTGNLTLTGGTDFSMDNSLDRMCLMYDGNNTTWVELWRTDNGA